MVEIDELINMDKTESLSAHEQTAIIAHRIYEKAGRPEGQAEEHWAQAEHILLEQRLAVTPADASFEQ